MTLEEIKKSDKEFLVVTDVVGLLPVKAQSIRAQAHNNPALLGFKVSVIGNKVLIPRIPFINFIEGRI